MINCLIYHRYHDEESINVIHMSVIIMVFDCWINLVLSLVATLLKFIPSLESDILFSLVTPTLLTLLHTRHRDTWLLEFVMAHIGAIIPSLPGLMPFHVLF